MAVRPTSRRRLAAVATGVALVASLGTVAASVQTHTTLQEQGRVKNLADGDTPYVDIYGDGTRTPVRDRMIGIQAAETKHPASGSRNWCHGLSRLSSTN
jgi:endonuclease YncB( thermonuclease family)